MEKLTEFAESVDVNGSNTDGLDIKSGFPLKLQPARQWFNWLFNKHSKKINEIIDSLKQAVEELNLGKLDTDANAASASKLNTPCKINGVDFDGAADINLPLIGIGQTWQDVSALRFDGVTYTNTSPRTRTVFFGGGRQGAPAAEFHVGDEIFALW
ncbi:MAG: hypothetical protein RSC68_08475, partial [Acinetobacter sp.]